MLQAIGKPFGWLLLKLYELTGNYGIALILFAVVIRLILMPFTVKSRLGVMKTQLIAPQMKELEKRHGTNSPKYAEEVRKLYKEEGIKPLSSCLWAFIQFPILLALYPAGPLSGYPLPTHRNDGCTGCPFAERRRNCRKTHRAGLFHNHVINICPDSTDRVHIQKF